MEMKIITIEMTFITWIHFFIIRYFIVMPSFALSPFATFFSLSDMILELFTNLYPLPSLFSAYSPILQSDCLAESTIVSSVGHSDSHLYLCYM